MGDDPQTAMDDFDSIWERMYSEGRMLNRYPYDMVVSLTFRYFGSVRDKSSVKVLDLGSGAGNNALFFAQEGFDITALEPSQSALDYAKKRFSDMRVKGKFLRMSFLQLNRLIETYDLILDRQSLCVMGIAEIRKILPTILDRMHEKSLFFSFFYTSDYPDMAYCESKGSFTTLDQRTLMEVFAGFEMTRLYKHETLPIIGGTENSLGKSEWIVVGKKRKTT